jgi:hypothetical protein
MRARSGLDVDLSYVAPISLRIRWRFIFGQANEGFAGFPSI